MSTRSIPWEVTAVRA